MSSRRTRRRTRSHSTSRFATGRRPSSPGSSTATLWATPRVGGEFGAGSSGWSHARTRCMFACSFRAIASTRHAGTAMAHASNLKRSPGMSMGSAFRSSTRCRRRTRCRSWRNKKNGSRATPALHCCGAKRSGGFEPYMMSASATFLWIGRPGRSPEARPNG